MNLIRMAYIHRFPISFLKFDVKLAAWDVLQGGGWLNKF